MSKIKSKDYVRLSDYAKVTGAVAVKRIGIGCALRHCSASEGNQYKKVKINNIEYSIYFCKKCGHYYSDNLNTQKTSVYYDKQKIYYSDRCIIELKRIDETSWHKNIQNHEYESYMIFFKSLHNPVKGDSTKVNNKRKKTINNQRQKLPEHIKSEMITPACPLGHDIVRKGQLSKVLSSVDIKVGGVSVYFCKECNCYYSNDTRVTSCGKQFEGKKILYSNAKMIRTIVDRRVISYRILPLDKSDNQTTINDRLLPFGRSKWGTNLPNLTEESRTHALLVYAQKCTCMACYNKYHGETIENRTAFVMTTRGEKVKVNVQFCKGCGRFYMNSKSLNAYSKLYGGLDFDFVFADDADNILNCNSRFNPSSVLSRHGYSVRSGIPKTSRQQALRRILDENIASKHEIIELLTQFIQLQKYRYPDACRRWEEDILFVNEYNIDEQEKTGLLKIKQAGKIKK